MEVLFNYFKKHNYNDKLDVRIIDIMDYSNKTSKCYKLKIYILNIIHILFHQFFQINQFLNNENDLQDTLLLRYQTALRQNLKIIISFPQDKINTKIK